MEKISHLKLLEDSSFTYDESEDISFRVSKLEDMIKGMASKDDLNGMASKEYIQELKEMIQHIFIQFLLENP